jgi:adenylate cyclase
MSPLLLALLAAGAALAAGAGALALHRRNRRLERLLDDATGKLEQLQLQFARFAPAEVVDRLAEGEGDPPPVRRSITVLFADLQGFTAMCDRLDPADTVRILNGFFHRMSAVIKAHHGRVTEMVGDELLALFGALETNRWQGQDAVLAALEMRTELARYNEELLAQALPPLRFGIGIHRGELLAGVIGNADLRKYGVVGDPINVASRVERLTRVHGVDVLITEAVRDGLGGRFRLRAMPAMQVRGKAEPIATFFVEGLADESVVPATGAALAST